MVMRFISPAVLSAGWLRHRRALSRLAVTQTGMLIAWTGYHRFLSSPMAVNLSLDSSARLAFAGLAQNVIKCRPCAWLIPRLYAMVFVVTIDLVRVSKLNE